MLLPNFIRTLSLIILLPAAGIGVAATTLIQESALTDESPIYSDPLGQTFEPLEPMSDGRQDSSTHSHVIQILGDGTIRGQITSDGVEGIAAMIIRISNDRDVLHTVVTDEHGRFVVNDVQPGVYSLYGQSEQAIVASGFYAATSNLSVAGGPVSTVNDDFQINTLATAAGDLDEIDRIRRHYLPSVDLLPEEDSNENHYAKALRQSFLINTPSLPIDIDSVVQDNANKTLSAGLTPTSVMLQGGTLQGELSQIVGQIIDFRHIHCFLIKDGTVIAEVPANAEGKFSVAGLTAGSYSFVAAGTGGFAAFQVQLIDETTASLTLDDGTQFVSTSRPTNAPLVSDVLSIALAMQQAGAPLQGDAGGGQDDGGDLGGGVDVGNGGGAGGGGGGGGGNAMTWGALGMAAAAIGVAGSDNNSQVLASPFMIQ